MKNLKRMWWAVSNAAYPLAALFIVGEPVFVALMLGLGVASAIYHWNHQRNADWDVGMIYAILLFLIGISWGLLPLLAVPLSLPGAYVLRKKVSTLNMEQKIAALIGPLFIFGFLSGAPLILAVVVLAVALAIRQWADHGAWHPISAVGLALVARALL